MSDDKEADFTEFFAIYLPADQSLATLGAWLAQRLPKATLGDDGIISVARRTQAPSRLLARLDASPAVRADVIARAKRGSADLRRALRPVMQRLDLEAADAHAKFDDLYDVFRALAALPGAVALIESDVDRFVEFYVGESEEPLAVVDLAD